jgi:uncharacterized protein YndB with AHSA1/START domain
MPTDQIEIARILPATPEQIYAAWLDADAHGAMTGGPATVESTEVGGRFTAWGGYIDGSHLALEPARRIVQSWRSDDFPPEALDSRLEVLLEPAPGGTRITLRHTDLPEGHGPGLLEGWDEHYLEPMRRYFERAARGPARRAPARAKAKVAAKPPRKPGARRLAARKVTARPATRKAAVKPANRKAAARPAARKASAKRPTRAPTRRR